MKMSLPLLNRLQQRGPDSRQGLKAVVASFMVMFLLSAGYKAQGVLFDVALREFSATREQIAWPMSLYQFSVNFSGLLLGPLAERFSIRPVFAVGAALGSAGFLASFFVKDYVWFSVTYGLLGGVTFGVAVLAASVLMSQYFDRFRAITIGITFCGTTVGAFIFPSLFSVLASTLGFHAIFVINGIICATSIPFAWIMKEPQWIDGGSNEPNSKPQCHRDYKLSDETQKSSVAPSSSVVHEKASLKEQLSVLMDGMFWLLCIPMVCYFWGNLACLTTIVDFHRTERNFSELQSVNILTAFGASELFGLLVLPHLSDHGVIFRETLLIANFVLAGTLLVLIPISPSYWITIAFISVLGPFYGLAASFYRSFVGDYLGVHRMKSAFGLLTAIKAICLLGVPFFIGYCRDVLHDYRLIYNICGGLQIGISLIYLPIIIKKRRYASAE